MGIVSKHNIRFIASKSHPDSMEEDGKISNKDALK